MRDSVAARTAFLIEESELRDWTRGLVKSGLSVIAPVEREEGHLAFEEVEDADSIVIDAERTISSPKPFFHPPKEEVLSSSPLRRDGRILFGVHACDLNGMKVLAGALLSTYSDPLFKNRIDRTAIVCATCCKPSENCFCTSMGTGPSISEGYDLLLTNLGDIYLLEVGSERGKTMVVGRKLQKATSESFTAKEEVLEGVRSRMPKQFRTLDIPEILSASFDSDAWEGFAESCLGCTNCTMVCPTCYCYDVRDWAAPSLQEHGRTRVWDSCQSFRFTSVHGGNYRPDQTARLRQFVCHKLAFWIEQYGRFGCVGCGRCMTWCPTGIDLTDIADAIRERQR